MPCKILGAKLLKKNEITAFSTLFNVKKCEKRVMSLEKSSLVPVVIASNSVVVPLQVRSKSLVPPLSHRVCTEFAPTLVRRKSEGRTKEKRKKCLAKNDVIS